MQRHNQRAVSSTRIQQVISALTLLTQYARNAMYAGAVALARSTAISGIE